MASNKETLQEEKKRADSAYQEFLERIKELKKKQMELYEAALGKAEKKRMKEIREEIHKDKTE